MEMVTKKYDKNFFNKEYGGSFTLDLEEYYNGGVNNGS
jgi:hypothetical protein